VYGSRDTVRDQLREDIVELVQRLTTESERLVHAFAARNGLHRTDVEALLHVMHAEGRGEPSTPGRLADALGVTSGAATGAIDRLERAGHVERRRSRDDRRKIHLHYADSGKEVAVAFFQPLGRLTDAIMEQFTDEELAVVRRYLAGIVEATAQEARRAR
jgi:DNA-binding MarR family transcriptional regulator